MKIKPLYIFIALGIIVLAGIAAGIYFFKFSKKEDKPDKPVAKAGEAILYDSDLQGLIPKGTAAADSTDMVNRFVESWIKKQLLIQKAEKEVEVNESEIEQKMLDYKYALLVYELEKKYIKEKLDTVVTNKEIADYYQSHLNDFPLRQNIIRSWIAVFSEKSPKLDKIRGYLNAGNIADKKELQSLCSQFATEFSLNDSVWTDFEIIVKNTPFQEIPNKVQFLQQNRFSEANSGNQIYFLRILEYKLTEQTSPLAFASSQIKDIIINQRKVNLTQQLEKDIYEQAKNNHNFEIYEK